MFCKKTCSSLKKMEQNLDLRLCYWIMARWCLRQCLLPAIQRRHNRLLINMTVQSVQQIRWQIKWNLENKTVKATQPSFVYLSIQGSSSSPAFSHIQDTAGLYPWPRTFIISVDCLASLHLSQGDFHWFDLAEVQDDANNIPLKLRLNPDKTTAVVTSNKNISKK